MITIDALFLGAAIHGVALVLLLTFNGYANRKANLLLALLVALLTITMWNVYINKVGGSLAFQIIDYYLWATPLLWAPVLYFYTGLLTKHRTLEWKSTIHFLPALFVGLLQIPLHFYKSTEIGSEVLNLTYFAVVVLIYPQIAFYMFRSFQIIYQFREKNKDQFSTLDKINLTWLIIVLISFSSILIVDMITNFLIIFGGLQLEFAYDFLLVLEATVIFVIGYLSLRQPEILTGEGILRKTDKNSGFAKYIGSPIDNRLGIELAEKLDRLMDKHKPYLTNDLTLNQLADLMALGTHHMSQIINQHHHKNFYDYINGYRARFAAELLLKNGKTNLTRLAFESGFNNRVSFNKAFRKYTGQTPTEYLKRQQTIKGQDA